MFKRFQIFFEFKVYSLRLLLKSDIILLYHIFYRKFSIYCTKTSSNDTLIPKLKRSYETVKSLGLSVYRKKEINKHKKPHYTNIVDFATSLKKKISFYLDLKSFQFRKKTGKRNLDKVKNTVGKKFWESKILSEIWTLFYAYHPSREKP